jgi:hypothetical protein
LDRRKWNEDIGTYEKSDDLVSTRVEWVSHGNYAILQPLDDFTIKEEGRKFSPYTWFDMEREYFDEILKAVEEKGLPETVEGLFEPFWKAVLPARGLHFYETQLRAYFWGRKKDAFVIHQQTYGRGQLSNKIEQIGFYVEDFRKIRDVALNSDRWRRVHYCKVSFP